MDANYSGLMPEIILCLTGVLVMLLASVLPRDRVGALGWVAAAGSLAAMIPVFLTWGVRDQAFFGMVFQDTYSQYGRLLFLLVLFAILILCRLYARQQQIAMAEMFSLVLFAGAGMNLMAASADLIMTFLGIELLSISSYVLAGYKESDRSAESAWKYFILGAFSTAFLLYGIAFLYGVTGSTSYTAIASEVGRWARTGNVPALALVGMGLLLVGFAFKGALVPFHVWTPDVYEGAPIPVTAFLAVGSKAAAFMALLRILEQVLAPLSLDWQGVFWLSAVATMFLGNLAALVQTNIKRMLAYSSIAHAGYLLVGVTAHSGMSREAVLFYLSAYAIMTVGAFAVIQLVAEGDDERVQLSQFKGLGSQRPFLATSLSIFLISMAGIPATAGFMGKLFLFSAAIDEGFYGLVILALIASAMGVYYYLRVIVLMYMQGGEASAVISDPWLARLALAALVLGTFGLGLFPGPVMNWISEATLF